MTGLGKRFASVVLSSMTNLIMVLFPAPVLCEIGTETLK